MDKTSGLKECPRCGLRNRRGAYQCDFCGWDFKAASDDWMGKVSDLEKIGREVEVADIDRTTRSKIEMTMKRPADVPAKERKPEKQLEVPAHLTLEDQGDVIAQPEAYPEVEEAVATEEESEVAAQVFSPAMEARTAPALEDKVEEVAAPETRSARKSFDTSSMVTYSMMGTGLAMYAVDLYLTTSHAIGRVPGWAVIIVASALIALAVMRLLPSLRARHADEEELVLCPVCHEVVTEADSKCPSCGVKFKETSTRE